ncbi:hypothetical protein CYMTET_11558 [Cymbomonas tetramitiformis]|uniref:RCC1-like domain-containing protein n=1 Tax=Cymbomonas tetramitiformis TaxID=36881 RepID=A0AAE0LCQ9_9CHLO|nr:hypothetical protein CYMTET_11558 [Cymbomonas tetramitiformis]
MDQRTTSSLFRALQRTEASSGLVLRTRKAGAAEAAEGQGVRQLKVLETKKRKHTSPAAIVRRKRQKSSEPSCGDFARLPHEVIEQILLQCNASSLGALSCTSSYFSASGIIERVALKLLRCTSRGLLIQQTPGETAAYLLHFVMQSEQVAVQSKKFALGSFHSAVLTDCPETLEGALYTFGRGFHGQLGHGGYDNSSVPLRVTLDVGSKEAVKEEVILDSDLKMVALGGSHCAALTHCGTLYTWGLASSGELGHGGWTPIEVDVPRPVTSLGKVRVEMVAAGSNHTLAVGTCGGLWSCGRGRHGQLGQGHYHDVGPLQRVESLRGIDVASASAGGGHSMVLTPEGKVWAWGDNRDGQLGLGMRGADVGLPWPHRVEVPHHHGSGSRSRQQGFFSVSTGGHHSLLVTMNGELLACGRARHGALGIDSKSNKRTPTRVDIGSLTEDMPCAACSQCARGKCRVVQAVAGGSHSLVVTACGEVRGAGCNAYGQLGLGDTTQRRAFTPIPAAQKAGLWGLAAGDDHSAAVGIDNKMYLWGRGDWGQLGLPDGRGHWLPQRLDGLILGEIRDESDSEGQLDDEGY